MTSARSADEGPATGQGNNYDVGGPQKCWVKGGQEIARKALAGSLEELEPFSRGQFDEAIRPQAVPQRSVLVFLCRAHGSIPQVLCLLFTDTCTKNLSARVFFRFGA